MSAIQHQQHLSTGADSKLRPRKPYQPSVCLADQQRTDKQGPAPTKACGSWHLFTGTVQLFIVGDATAAWLPCSEPEYRKGEQAGTPRERSIANRAIEILRAEQNQNPEAGPREIRDAITRATVIEDRLSAA